MTLTWVYRLIGPCDSLLYVGCTTDLAARMRTHRRRFGAELVRYESDVYPSRVAGLIAERDAIRHESPAYNKQHATNGATTTDQGSQYILSRLERAGLTLHDVTRAGIPMPTLRRCLLNSGLFTMPHLERIAGLLGMKTSALVIGMGY